MCCLTCWTSVQEREARVSSPPSPSSRQQTLTINVQTQQTPLPNLPQLLQLVMHSHLPILQINRRELSTRARVVLEPLDEELPQRRVRGR